MVCQHAHIQHSEPGPLALSTFAGSPILGIVCLCVSVLLTSAGAQRATNYQTTRKQPPPACGPPGCLPVSRGRVARPGLGLRGGRCAGRSCVSARFLLPLERLTRAVLPVSGSFWMNFFSTYFDRIHDSLSPLRGGMETEGCS